MIELIKEYSDWIYIAAVILAFFIFLFWNRKTHGKKSRAQRKSFRSRVEEKRGER